MKDRDPFTVEIAGGLGNQLFMFYAGLYFQELFKREVIFEISDLSRIEKLHPGANIRSLGLLDGYRTISESKPSFDRIATAISRVSRLSAKKLHTKRFTPEEIGYVSPDLIRNDVNVIKGYFQSWYYFDSLKEKPILSINNIPNPSSWLIEKIERARCENILSLHVRRGDYALPANRSHGILSVDYYRKVLLSSRNYDSIWIFTDSPKEVKEEFSQLGHPIEIIVPPRNSDPVESLLLMSATKSIVISNSTFSWWSAMISEDNTQIYAPSKWFEFRDDPTKLIPAAWNRIPSEWMKQ